MEISMRSIHTHLKSTSFRTPLLVTLVTLVFVAFGSNTSAQDDGDERLSARGVAALVQSFYDQRDAFSADFEQVQFTRVHNHTERGRGRVVFEKPGRMRWDYEEPNGKVFVSDGETMTIYEPPAEGEERGQLIQRPISEDQLPAALSFLTGTGRLDRDFTFRLLNAERYGFSAGYVLELRPREETPHFERVLFYVQITGEGRRRAGVIRRVLILDQHGNRNSLTFRNMSFPEDVPDSRFSYRAPSNARRVQQ